MTGGCHSRQREDTMEGAHDNSTVVVDREEAQRRKAARAGN